MAKTENPWDRLDNETPAPWRAFQAFLALAPGERSLGAVQVEVKTDEGPDYAIGTLQQWSSAWLWFERAQAYDEHMADRRHEGVGDAHAKQGAELAKKQLRVLARALDVAERGLGELQGDAETKPLRLPVTPQALRGLLREAVVLSRLILGEATERVEETGESWVSKLTPEERAELVRKRDEASKR